jgi:hypothetical protein
MAISQMEGKEQAMGEINGQGQCGGTSSILGLHHYHSWQWG